MGTGLIVFGDSFCDLISKTEKCLQVSLPSKGVLSTLVFKEKDAQVNTVETRIQEGLAEVKERVPKPKLFLMDLKDDQFSSFSGVSRQQLQFFLLRIGGKLQDVPSISREMCLALVFVKMKTDMSYLNLSAMFGVDKSRVKQHFVRAFWPLYEASKDLIIWYSREAFL